MSPSVTPIKRRRQSYPLCRVIGVGDADHFETQIYQKHPEHRKTIGFPTIITQEGGRIVSLSPEAKQLGIKRTMREYQAKRICPSVFIIQKKKKFDKSDATEVEEYSVKIRAAVLKFRSEKMAWARVGLEKADLPIEMSGCDEFFMDLTNYVNCLIEQGCTLDFDSTANITMEGKRCPYNGSGLSNRNKYYYTQVKFHHTEEIRLAYGLEIMDELCRHVFKETGIAISGGVGSNKVLAKLACKLNKPDAVTALTRRGFYRVSHKVLFRDLSGFGGDLGESLESLFGSINLKQMRQAICLDYILLKRHLQDDERTLKARQLVFGVCHDPVQNKLMSKGTNCGKGNLNIRTESEFRSELNIRVQNILDKIKKEAKDNKRISKGLSVQYWVKDQPNSRTFRIDLDAVDTGDDGIGWNHKSLFDKAAKSAVNENPRFAADLQNVIVKLNFRISDYHQFSQIAFIAIARKIDLL